MICLKTKKTYSGGKAEDFFYKKKQKKAQYMADLTGK